MPKPVLTRTLAAPHLHRFWCRSEAEPLIGYWSRAFIGWVSYHEDVLLIQHGQLAAADRRKGFGRD